MMMMMNIKSIYARLPRHRLAHVIVKHNIFLIIIYSHQIAKRMLEELMNESPGAGRQPNVGTECVGVSRRHEHNLAKVKDDKNNIRNHYLAKFTLLKITNISQIMHDGCTITRTPKLCKSALLHNIENNLTLYDLL